MTIFVNLSACISFRPVNHGRLVTADLYLRYKSTVSPLRKTIGPVTCVTSKTVISIRDRNPMCFVLIIFRLVNYHKIQNNKFVD